MFYLVTNMYNKFNSKHLLYTSPKILTFLWKGLIQSVTRKLNQNLSSMIQKDLSTLASAHFFYLMVPTFLPVYTPTAMLTSFYFLPLRALCLSHLFPCCLPGSLLIQLLTQTSSQPSSLNHHLSPNPTAVTVILYHTAPCTSLLCNYSQVCLPNLSGYFVNQLK